MIRCLLPLAPLCLFLLAGAAAGYLVGFMLALCLLACHATPVRFTSCLIFAMLAQQPPGSPLLL